MNKGNARHMFPGGNTSLGFYSYYDYIIPQEQANHIFCLKGGPGVGKSTFMKKIGDAMLDKGYDVEFLHCSSDNSSLDGIFFPVIKVALIDGTAPHIIDPKNPGAVDEILNLGDYWTLENIKENREEILSANREVGVLFKRAYKYLAAAKSLYDDSKDIYQRAANIAGANMEAEKLISNELFFLPVCDSLGSIRKQFASAITPDGLISHLDTIIPQDYSIYSISGMQGSGISLLMERITNESMMRGLDVEAYYCPMEPDCKIEHLIISELRLALTINNKYHYLERENIEYIDMSRYVNQDVLMHNNNALEFNIMNYDLLIAKAISTINTAKQTHDYMETFYIPNMDFASQHKLGNEVLNRVLDFVK